jgi:hypothetical protein
MDASLLNLPVQIQIALGSGYAAYMTAHAGIRGHHSATEVAMRSIAYGLVATAALALMPRGSNMVVGGAVTFLITIFAAMFWRRIGCRLWRDLLRRAGVSWSDDSPSAWMSFGENTDHYVSQIAVQLDDGTWLQCNDTARFRDAPFGPCVLGSNGDVALYLTHEEEPDGKSKELKTVLDPHYGARLTYVPAARIKRVTMRHIARPM